MTGNHSFNRLHAWQWQIPTRWHDDHGTVGTQISSSTWMATAGAHTMTWWP